MLKKRKLKPKELENSIEIELPTKLSAPSSSIGDYAILIYGERKIGKTSMLSHFGKTLMCMFEPGGKALKLLQISIPSWQHFRKLVEQLENTDTDYTTLCIDTGTIAYERCAEYICSNKDIEYLGDLDYGKGWNMAKAEFKSMIGRMMLLGKGFVVTAHSTMQEVETRSGRKVSTVTPNFSKGADEFFTGTMDLVGYYHFENNERWLQIRGNDHIVAGCRMEINFIAKDGKPVYKIPMGSSSREAYQNFMKAFNNQQEKSFWPEEKTLTKAIKVKK